MTEPELARTADAEAPPRAEHEEHETLSRIGLALAGEHELERLVQRLTDEATAAVGAEFGAFFYNVVDAQGESFMLYTISGVPREAFSRFPMPRNTDVFAPTFRGDGVVRSDDIRQDPRYGKNAPHHGMPAGHLPVVSYLAAPVVARSGEVIGGLFFGHGQRARFGEREERVLLGIAAQAGLAFESARLIQRLRHQEARLEKRARAAMVAASIGTLITRRVDQAEGALLEESVRLLAEHPDVASADVWLASDGHLAVAASSDGRRSGDRIPLGEGPIGRAARDRVVTIDGGSGTSEGPPRALAALPLLADGALLGVLAVASREALRAETLDDLAPVVDLIALGVQRAADAAALRASEVKHRLVAQASNEGIWSWDVRTGVVEWNDRLLELMGVDRARWGGTFQDWFERVHPDDQPILRRALDDHLAGRAPYDVPRFRLRHEDGAYRICRTRGQADFDPSGQPLRMAGSFADVTEQVRAEEALAASELRYRQILDSVRDMVFVKRAGSTVTYANAATCAHYGMSAEALRGITDVPFNQRDFTQKYLSDDREVIEHGRVVEDLEEPNVRHDGEVRYFHVVKSPIRDASGAVVELVGVARDVTERKRREDDRRFLAEASALLVSSIDYEVTLANVAKLAVPRFADWFAIDALEDDGAITRLTVHHHDPAKVALAAELERRYPTPRDAPSGVPAVLRTGVPEVVAEIPEEMLIQSARDPEHLEVIRSLGLRSYMVLPLEAHGRRLGALTLVAAESGRRYDDAAVSLARELAERIAVALVNARLYRDAKDALAARDAALASLRSFNDELERRVRERTTALEETNRELESFSYTVSHDLRAPIRHISGFVDLLRAHGEGKLDEKSQRWLRTIGDASKQMGLLIDSLLAFSRMGRAEIARTHVPLGDVVRAVLEDARPDLEGREVRLDVAPLPRVAGDPAMLRVVLHNLVENALKYTRRRDVAHVQIGWRREGADAVVWVKDDGVGFDMQYANKLFGVFQRLHVDPAFEGTGIGLATVRRIVQRHGGRTWAEAAPDRGATFFLTLPLAAPEAP